MKPFTSPFAVFLAAALLPCAAILFAGCAAPAPTPGPTPAPFATLTVTLGASLTPAAPSPSSLTSGPASPVTLRTPVAATPTPPAPTTSLASAPRLVVLAQNLPGPDDLVLGPDGLIYFSDVGDGTVKRLEANGAVSVLLSRLSEPEGLVWLPGGMLIIAEQGKNRLLQYDPAAKQLRTWLQLQNRTGSPGVDGIAYDARDGTVLVPDSPNGTLLRVSADGKTVTVLARGMARPTGAAVERDGSILIVDENAGALLRLRPGSALERIARLPVPDDVVVGSDGVIYVNTLNEGAIHVIDPATGQSRIFFAGLSNPQGIVLDPDGNLVVADAGNRRLVRLMPTS